MPELILSPQGCLVDECMLASTMGLRAMTYGEHIMDVQGEPFQREMCRLDAQEGS